MDTHRDPEVRRLALEIQTARYALSELEAMAAEAHFYATQHASTLADAQKALARIWRRLTAELQRIGPVAPKRR